MAYVPQKWDCNRNRILIKQWIWGFTFSDKPIPKIPCKNHWKPKGITLACELGIGRKIMRKIMLLDRPRPDLILGEILEQVAKLKLTPNWPWGFLILPAPKEKVEPTNDHKSCQQGTVNESVDAFAFPSVKYAHGSDEKPQPCQGQRQLNWFWSAHCWNMLKRMLAMFRLFQQPLIIPKTQLWTFKCSGTFMAPSNLTLPEWPKKIPRFSGSIHGFRLQFFNRPLS